LIRLNAQHGGTECFYLFLEIFASGNGGISSDKHGTAGKTPQTHGYGIGIRVHINNGLNRDIQFFGGNLPEGGFTPLADVYGSH
jgi:hypothetical protein